MKIRRHIDVKRQSLHMYSNIQCQLTWFSLYAQSKASVVKEFIITFDIPFTLWSIMTRGGWLGPFEEYKSMPGKVQHWNKIILYRIHSGPELQW